MKEDDWVIEIDDYELFTAIIVILLLILFYFSSFFRDYLLQFLLTPLQKISSTITKQSNNDWMREISLVCRMVKWIETNEPWDLTSENEEDLLIHTNDLYLSSYPVKFRFFTVQERNKNEKKLYVMISVNRLMWFENDEFYPLHFSFPSARTPQTTAVGGGTIGGTAGEGKEEEGGLSNGGLIYKPIHDFLSVMNLSFFLNLVKEKYYTKIVFGGHGVGGSFAQLLCLKCCEVYSTVLLHDENDHQNNNASNLDGSAKIKEELFVSITFGAARCGDEQCIKYLNSFVKKVPYCHITNFIHHQDIVPLIPPMKLPQVRRNAASTATTEENDTEQSIRRNLLESLHNSSTNHSRQKSNILIIKDWEKVKLYFTKLFWNLIHNKATLLGNNWILFGKTDGTTKEEMQLFQPENGYSLYFNVDKNFPFHSFNEHNMICYSWSFQQFDGPHLIPLTIENNFWYETFHPHIEVRLESIPIVLHQEVKTTYSSSTSSSSVSSSLKKKKTTKKKKRLSSLFLRKSLTIDNLIFSIIGTPTSCFDFTKSTDVNLFYQDDVLLIDLHDPFIEGGLIQSMTELILNQHYQLTFSKNELRITMNVYLLELEVNKIEVIYRSFPFLKPLSTIKRLN